MNHILIRASFRFICPLLAIISFVLFLRGHNLPGGGFIGGLCLSLALILRILSSKKTNLDSNLRKHFSFLVGLNLFGIAFVLLLPVFFGLPILTGLWTTIPFPIAGKLSSVLAFDFFIYLLIAVCTTRAYLEFTDFSGEGRFK